jgi:hypothetical protein
MSARDMRRLLCGAVLGVCALLWTGASRADDVAELRTLVLEQSEQIRGLQDQVRKLEEDAPTPASPGAVDTIDQRILDFPGAPDPTPRARGKSMARLSTRTTAAGATSIELPRSSTVRSGRSSPHTCASWAGFLPTNLGRSMNT